jgi:hypothetical protein
MTFHFSRIAREYFYAGKLLHFITLFELLLILFVVPIVLRIDSSGNIFLLALKIYLIGYLLSLPIFAQLDARSRYQNFKQIRDQIVLYGFSHRILKPVLKSRCQRDAAWYAAKETGYGHRCKSYFYKNGYRWFHLFPDFVFQKPQFLFTTYFWRTTFFAPRYIPKVDFPNPALSNGIIMNAESSTCATR